MILSLLTLLPLLGTLVVFIFGEENKMNTLKITCLILTVIDLLIFLIIWFLFDNSFKHFQFMQEPYTVGHYDFYLGLDGLSIFIYVGATFLIFVSMLINIRVWLRISDANNLNLIPVISKYAIKIKKSFFNLYNKNNNTCLGYLLNIGWLFTLSFVAQNLTGLVLLYYYSSSLTDLLDTLNNITILVNDEFLKRHLSSTIILILFALRWGSLYSGSHKPVTFYMGIALVLLNADNIFDILYNNLTFTVSESTLQAYIKLTFMMPTVMVLLIFLVSLHLNVSNDSLHISENCHTSLISPDFIVKDLIKIIFFFIILCIIISMPHMFYSIDYIISKLNWCLSYKSYISLFIIGLCICVNAQIYISFFKLHPVLSLLFFLVITIFVLAHINPIYADSPSSSRQATHRWLDLVIGSGGRVHVDGELVSFQPQSRIATRKVGLFYIKDETMTDAECRQKLERFSRLIYFINEQLKISYSLRTTSVSDVELDRFDQLASTIPELRPHLIWYIRSGW